MTMTMIRPKALSVPEPTPLRGTLLDAATVQEGAYASQGTTGLFSTLNCISVDHQATFPCPPNDLAAPTQTAPSTNTSGGTLAAGTYRAKITAVNTRGETTASAEQSQVTTGSSSRVTWNWNAVTGATGYRIYVTNAGANTETFLVEVGAVTTYNWTGTPAYSASNNAPPTVNTAVVPVTKTFESPSWQDAFTFAVQSGLVCKMVGFDPQVSEADLKRVVANKESVAVARALMQTRFVDGGSANWEAATDLTPSGGAVAPEVGLAMLEGHAASNYAGAPTLHVPRTIGSLLINKYNAITFDGAMLRTQLGSKVAADGGYESPSNGPAGTEPTNGELWLYASGEVTVAPGDAIVRGGLDLVESNDSNRYRILWERPYIATVDCYTAAVRVSVE